PLRIPLALLATLEETQCPEILFFDLRHVRGRWNLAGTPVSFGFFVARFYPIDDLVFSYCLSFCLFVYVLRNHLQEFFRVDGLDDVGICLSIYGFDGVVQSRISCEDDFPRFRKHPVDLREYLCPVRVWQVDVDDCYSVEPSFALFE